MRALPPRRGPSSAYHRATHPPRGHPSRIFRIHLPAHSRPCSSSSHTPPLRRSIPLPTSHFLSIPHPQSSPSALGPITQQPLSLSLSPPNLSAFFPVHFKDRVDPYTKCPGSKKFGTPSSTLYSCAQFPHTSLPSRTVVSTSTRWRSRAVWLGTSSASSSSVPGVVPGSMRSSRVGARSGREGRPSCGAGSVSMVGMK